MGDKLRSLDPRGMPPMQCRICGARTAEVGLTATAAKRVMLGTPLLPSVQELSALTNKDRAGARLGRACSRKAPASPSRTSVSSSTTVRQRSSVSVPAVRCSPRRPGVATTRSTPASSSWRCVRQGKPPAQRQLVFLFRTAQAWPPLGCPAQAHDPSTPSFERSPLPPDGKHTLPLTRELKEYCGANPVLRLQ